MFAGCGNKAADNSSAADNSAADNSAAESTNDAAQQSDKVEYYSYFLIFPSSI
jgi:arabinogalactan oligomer/maltooligosaccharide transport system substrate-binding protein